MMNMNLEQGGGVDTDMSATFASHQHHRPASSSGYGDMYRTDSPAPFSSDSPLPYVPTGSPMPYGVGTGAGQFAKHGLYSVDMGDAPQFSTSEDGYYSTVHPQHVTL